MGIDKGSVPETFSKTITINAPVVDVWKALTDTDLVNQWMMDETLEIITDWKAGSLLLIKGNAHWVYFENKGMILRSDFEKALAYSHLSSLSKLPDLPENYSITEFNLTALEGRTELSLTLGNFPTESIYQHLVFYWNVTLTVFKKFTEHYFQIKET